MHAWIMMHTTYIRRVKRVCAINRYEGAQALRQASAMLSITFDLIVCRHYEGSVWRIWELFQQVCCCSCEAVSCLDQHSHERTTEITPAWECYSEEEGGCVMS